MYVQKQVLGLCVYWYVETHAYRQILVLKTAEASILRKNKSSSEWAEKQLQKNLSEKKHQEYIKWKTYKWIISSQKSQAQFERLGGTLNTLKWVLM